MTRSTACALLALLLAGAACTNDYDSIVVDPSLDPAALSGGTSGAAGAAGDGQSGDAGQAGSSPLSCAPGTANCNSSEADGCESQLSSDAKHCGACGNDCSRLGAFVCFSGICGCERDEDCRGSGVNFATCDETSRQCRCGQGLACGAGEICARRNKKTVCTCNDQQGCSIGQQCCPEVGCVTLDDNPQHCGACGNACAAGQVCKSGACASG